MKREDWSRQKGPYCGACGVKILRLMRSPGGRPSFAPILLD